MLGKPRDSALVLGSCKVRLHACFVWHLRVADGMSDRKSRDEWEAGVWILVDVAKACESGSRLFFFFFSFGVS